MGQTKPKWKTRRRALKPRPPRSRLAPSSVRPQRAPMALLVLGLCWGAYMINGDPLPGNDQQANMLMSVNLLKHASLSIDPRQAPENFAWQVNRAREEPSSGTLSAWSAAAQRSYETGELTARPKYYLIPSTHPQQYVGLSGSELPWRRSRCTDCSICLSMWPPIAIGGGRGQSSRLRCLSPSQRFWSF